MIDCGGGGGGIAALLLSALLLSPSSAQRPTLHELSTTYEGGWRQDGVMFDVRVDTVDGLDPLSGGGISVRALDVLTPQDETFCLEVYTRLGPYEEAASDPAGWTFLGSFDLEGQGAVTPTTLPVGAFEPLPVAVGSTRAFYVTTQNEELRYTALTSQSTGDVFSSSRHTDEDVAVGADGTETTTTSGLAVSVIVGVAKNYPFTESWPDRVFNGAVKYTLDGGGEVEALTLTDDERAAADAARRGLVTCDMPAEVATSAPTSAPNTLDPTPSPSESPSEKAQGIIEGEPTAVPTTLDSTTLKIATTLSGGRKQSGLMFDIYVPTVEEVSLGCDEGRAVGDRKNMLRMTPVSTFLAGLELARLSHSLSRLPLSSPVSRIELVRPSRRTGRSRRGHHGPLLRVLYRQDRRDLR